MVRYSQLAGRNRLYAGMSILSKLPDHYYNYLMELEQPGERVHDVKEEAEILDYKLADRETLRIKRVPDTPMNVIYPEEADRGIWGGEGIVKGFYKFRTFWGRYNPWLFMPLMYNSQVYSEVLDVYLKVTLGERALFLFDKAMGFDNYILRTPMRDFKSNLALKLRRKMLITLAKEDYYPNDPERRAYIREKYADCVIPLEQAEWIGLTLDEALEKVKLEELKNNPVLPLKHKYRKELIQTMKQRRDEGLLQVQPPQPSLLSTMLSPLQSLVHSVTGRLVRRSGN